MAGFTFQVIYNVTMSVGLAPVKGLPLPLMSYGGSSVIATLIGFGLILHVRMRGFVRFTMLDDENRCRHEGEFVPVQCAYEFAAGTTGDWST